MITEAQGRDKQIIEAVRKAAEEYWSGIDETVTIESIHISDEDAMGDVEVLVEWSSKSTRDGERDDMIYTVSELDDGTMDVFGPEW